jgi:hypothetical protein
VFKVMHVPLTRTQEPGMMTHACDPSTWEAEVEGWPVPDQTGLNGETLSQKNKTKSHKGPASAQWKADS